MIVKPEVVWRISEACWTLAILLTPWLLMRRAASKPTATPNSWRSQPYDS